jgi:hypothetical protein
MYSLCQVHHVFIYTHLCTDICMIDPVNALSEYPDPVANTVPKQL